MPQTDTFLTQVDSVKAQDILDRHFPSDESSPVVVIAPQGDLQKVARRGARRGRGRRRRRQLPARPVRPPARRRRRRRWSTATSSCWPPSRAPPSRRRPPTPCARLRTDLDRVGADVLVGGNTAIQLDARDTTDADRARVIPAILVVIFIVLALLLRSLAAPLLLVLANVLSFGGDHRDQRARVQPRLRLPGDRPVDLADRLRVPGGARHRLLDLPDDPGAGGVRQTGDPPGRAQGAVRHRRRDHLGRASCWPRRSRRWAWCRSCSWRRSRSSSRSACCSTPWSCGRCWCRPSPTTSGRGSGGPPSCGTPRTTPTGPPRRCCTSAAPTASGSRTDDGGARRRAADRATGPRPRPPGLWTSADARSADSATLVR